MPFYRSEEGAIHPVFRFVARHSLFIGPGIGFVLAAVAMSRADASWTLWAALVAAMGILWTVPIWRRQEPSPLRSVEEIEQQLRGGTISFLHFYSDF